MPWPVAAAPAPGGSSRGVNIRIREIESRFKDPSGFLKQVGFLLLSASQKAFVDQKFGSAKWPARMNPNVPGAMRDLEKGPSIKERRFDPRPAVMDTGTLKRSLSPAVHSALPRRSAPGLARVTVGTTVPYAAKQHFGSAFESIPVTDTIKKNLAIVLRRARGGWKRAIRKFDRATTLGEKAERGAAIDKAGDKAMRYARLGFLFNLKTFNFRIRRRPFLGVTADVLRKIRTQGERYFSGKGR